MLLVLVGIFRVDDDVVEVGGAMVEPVVENAVHEALEYCGRILEPKWHNVVLKETSWGFEGRLRFVALPDPDVVKAGPEVELGKDLRRGWSPRLTAEPRRARTSFTVLGTSQSLMAWTFLSSMAIPSPAYMAKPRYSQRFGLNSHFSGRSLQSASSRSRMTPRTCCWCCSGFSE